MKKLKAWIDAFRLRTLPLSFSLIFVGSALAYQYDCFDVMIFVMAIVTTLFLQILSNISNDYGDAVSGADFAGRKGPQRAVQSGQIGYNEMKKAIYVFVLLSLVSGVALLITAYPRLHTSGFVMMLSIGIASIIAAICYTIGKKPYGYIGLGDFFVFWHCRCPWIFCPLSRNSGMDCRIASVKHRFAVCWRPQHEQYA